ATGWRGRLPRRAADSPQLHELAPALSEAGGVQPAGGGAAAARGRPPAAAPPRAATAARVPPPLPHAARLPRRLARPPPRHAHGLVHLRLVRAARPHPSRCGGTLPSPAAAGEGPGVRAHAAY